jgi:methionine-rich copper-binding protein CopC
MQKLFRLTALLIAAMLVVWVVGCGDDDDDDDDDAEPAASVTGVTPADGATNVPANTKIIVTFDNAVTDATINGKPATLGGGGKTAEVADAGLAEGAQTVSITWTNKDGSAGSHSVGYTVAAADKTAPSVVDSTPADGDSKVEPDDVNANGMEIKFDEAVTGTITVTLEGNPLNWKAAFDGDTVTLQPLKGADLGFEKEYVIEGTVKDAAGNETEVEITFTTKGKED